MHLTRDTSVLLPDIVKERAQRDPQGVFARVPIGPAYSNGFTDVTNTQLQNAVNFTASLLATAYGETKMFETLAYIGSVDLRYSIMMLAGMKISYKVFLPSPRNSIEAHTALLKGLQCTKLVVTEPQAPCVPSILSKLKLNTFVLPSLHQLLNVGDVEDVRFEKTFEQVRDEPIFVLHTSGSTGIPKPLVYTHDWVSKMLGSCCIESSDGQMDFGQYVTRGTFFITLPPFHVAGVGLGLLMALFYGMTPVYPIAGPPPTTEAFVTAISNTTIDWAIVPPVVIHELGKREELLDVFVSRLKYLFYAGGSVPKASGDAVARRLTLLSLLGSSEAGVTPLVHIKDGYNKAEDWVYMSFNPALKHEMRLLHEDYHELVLIRRDDTESFQPAFTHFPDVTEYPTRDLFRPHPTKNGLWMYHSRIDDVIVFLNGEKTNPVSFEHHVTGHPEVRAALVVGAQRVEAALLIEPTGDAKLNDEERTALIERIWPFVEKANKVTPAHARVAKNKMLFVDPSTPMARAGKGTVQRAATLSLYSTEIEKLYEQTDSVETFSSNERTDQDNRTLIRNAVAEVVSMDDLDLFQLGLDSLGAFRLQRALRKQFPGVIIANDVVYSHSSVNALVDLLDNSAHVAEEVSTKVNSANRSPTIEELATVPIEGKMTILEPDSRSGEIADMLKTFCKEVDDISPRKDAPSHEAQEQDTVILLTGATGAIGSYVLDTFLSNTDISHVFCLNRTSNAQERQTKSHQNRGLETAFPPERVSFLNGDLAKPIFGLHAEQYDDLLGRVTHIVHNAWPVNFNMPLATFGPSIAGVVQLIRLAAQSKTGCSIQFYSSISTVFKYPNETVPEEIVPDLVTPSPGGYGKSKYLAECLLDRAFKNVGVVTSVVRIGQVAGAARTASGWSQHEWFPSLVTSSASMGALPATLGEGTAKADWVPIDHLASVLVELALAPRHGRSGEQGAAVHHVVHPRPVTWASILPVVKEIIESSSSAKLPIRVVPYGEWLAILKEKGTEADGDGDIDYATLLRGFPGLKLIGFYEGLQGDTERGLNLKFSLERTLKISSMLMELEPLEHRWIAGWVKGWLETMRMQ